jgi:ComF family protein
MFFRAVLDILFPPLCHVCKTYIPNSGSIHICAACSEKIIPVSSPKCTVCGIPFNTENGIDHVCGACATASRPYVSARAAVHFAGPAQDLIHRLKYGKKVHLSRPLGLVAVRHLAGFLDETGVEMIVPVPLHPRRLRERGFNQAILLADPLSKSRRIPISRNNLRRIRWTEPQINLSPEDRVKNVRGAFAVRKPELFEGKKLVLVDDVYTTGSTVGECAKVLKRAGAGHVYVATVARAVFD